MELSEKAVEEIIKQSLVTFDEVAKEQPDIKDWKSIFEAAFACVLSLRSTTALQLFTVMCLCALDFEAYSELEDVFVNHPKTIPMQNTLWYRQLNEEEKNSSE